MSDLLEVAEKIARDAHAGQLYGDADYFEAHIKPVVNIVRRLGFGPEYQAAAYLHDVIEDTKERDEKNRITKDKLVALGIPARVAHSVQLLSKEPDISHEMYMTLIGHDAMATVSKLADSVVNLGNTALGGEGLSDEKFNEWFDEYTDNIKYLRDRKPHAPGILL